MLLSCLLSKRIGLFRKRESAWLYGRDKPLLSIKFFSTFIKFVNALSKIEKQPSSIEKKSILKSYLQTTERAQLPIIEKLFKYSFNPFASISSKSIENMLISEGLTSKETIKKLLNENNEDLAKVISLIYERKGIREIIPSTDLEIKTLVEKLEKMKETKGHGSQNMKFKTIKLLFDSCSKGIQLEYLTRILTRNLNLGMTTKSIQPILDQIFQKNPLSGQTQISQPTQHSPMLAKPLKSFQQALRFSVNKGCHIAAQVKYDGQRTNIFYERNKLLRLISRSGKDQYDSFPDLYEVIKKQLDAIPDLQNIILDGEIVVVEKQTEKPMTVQALTGRKGKSRENMKVIEKEMIMVFDVLEKNGKNLLGKSYLQRLQEVPKFGQGICTQAKRKIFNLPDDKEALKKYFEEQIKQGYQGIIIKPCNSTYDTKGGRKDWAKLKKDCTIQNRIFQGVELDLILMGVDKGRGRRSNTFGSFLFGTLYKNKIIPICKVGTGLSDLDLYELTIIANKLIVATPPQSYEIPDSLIVDFWCRPELICEISSQEFTRSPLYKFGEEPGKGGVSLRFPKFVRRREDKSIQQVTSGEEILSQLPTSSDSVSGSD